MDIKRTLHVCLVSALSLTDFDRTRMYSRSPWLMMEHYALLKEHCTRVTNKG